MTAAIAVAYLVLVGGVIATGQGPALLIVVVVLGVAAFGWIAMRTHRALSRAWGDEEDQSIDAVRRN